MATPKFDPSKPFEPVGDSTPKFDPTREFTPVEASASSEALQTVEDALRGAAQSASFGFADELTGAGEAAMGAMTGADELANLLANYEKYRDQSRSNYKQAEDRSPSAYFAGELAGGLVPGFGAVKAGLTGAKTIGQAAIKAAQTGGLAGAAFGAGTSEAQAIPELAGDVAAGAGMGALTGGAVSGATGLATKGIGNLMNKSGFVRDIVEASKRGLSGEDLVGPDARRATERALYSSGKEIQDMLSGEVSRGRGMKTSAIAQGEELGVKTDIEKLLKEYEMKVMAAPERLPQQKAEKEQLLSLIRNELYGPEQTVEKIIPGKTSVIPGDILASGEDVAREKLLQQQGKLGAKKIMGEPELAAEAKLKQKFGQKELTSEALEDPLVPFTGAAKSPTTAGVEGLTATSPTGGPMAQMIKDIKPGEIKEIVDPATGKRFMGFIDEATGKAYLEPLEDIGERTAIKFRNTPESVEKITQRTGGKTDMSPEQLNQLIKDFSETSRLGDQSFKTESISKLSTDLTKDLKGVLKGDAFGEISEKIAHSDKVMSSALDAQELLGRATSSLTTADKASVQKAIGEVIKKAEQDTSGGASARFMVEEAVEKLKGTNPELAKKISDKIVDKATAYDLAKKIGAESAIQGRFLATAQGAALGAANTAGKALSNMKPVVNAATAAKNVTQNIRSFINGSSPETLKLTREALEAKGNVSSDLLEKLAAAEAAPTNMARNSILFALMQSYDYRQALGISGAENE